VSSPSQEYPQGPPPDNTKGKRGYKRKGSKDELVELGFKLWDAGFNVVPVKNVGDTKRALTSWGSSKRVDRDVLARKLKEATGIGICGGLENPFKPATYLIPIDIDKPSLLEKSAILKELVNKTVSWYTGPRCTKCESKHVYAVEPGKRFKCEKCGNEFNIEGCKRGIALLVSVDLETYEKYFSKGGIKTGEIELQVNNYQVVPPSLHPTGVKYEWIKPIDFNSPNYGIYMLGMFELEKLLSELAKLGIIKSLEAKTEAKEVEKPEEVRELKLRELKYEDIQRIYDLLKVAYRPGVRQYIWLYLSGWGARARISPVSVGKILKMLYDGCGDDDPLKVRASAIVYSYKKAGIDLTQYANDFESLFGVRPYGLEKEINESEVKGRSGLEEVLENILGSEEKAVGIIKEIDDVFQVASPFRDSIIEVIQYYPRRYAIANLRKLVVVVGGWVEVKGKDEEGNKTVTTEFKYFDRVAIGAPTEVVVYLNPIGGMTKYQVRWETLTRPKPLILGPALLEDIVGRLKAEGLIVNSRKAGDIISAVIEGFIRRGKATIKYELESPGFYLVREDGSERIVSVGYEVREPSKEELKEALALLDNLVRVWFKDVQDRFVTAIKWWLVAPFNYVVKQMSKGNSYIQALYQYGPPNTRKSTINQIGMKIWGFRYPEITSKEEEIPGSAVNTCARLEYWFGRGTFPVGVKEPRGLFENEDKEVVEMLKSGIDGLMARGKHRGSSYIATPALALFSFTSNTYLPRETGLVGKRLFVLKYSYAEALNPEKKEVRELMNRFEVEVVPQLSKLSPLGRYVAFRVTENPKLLEGVSWVGNTWLELAEKLLVEAYEYVGLTPPEWIKLRYVVESMTEIYEDSKELIRTFLVERINNEYIKFVGKVVVEKPSDTITYDLVPRYEVGLEDRVKIVLEYRLIPWLVLKGGNVYITTGLVKELEKVGIDIGGGLKSIAELLGWEYEKEVRIGRSVISSIRTSVEDLVEFLGGESK